MGKVIELPDNLITPEDQESLESFGGHEIALGRATRFHWDENDNGDPVFEIYRGGEDEELVLTIFRDREHDVFIAEKPDGQDIVSGSLKHVMTVLDKRLKREHDENNSA